MNTQTASGQAGSRRLPSCDQLVLRTLLNPAARAAGACSVRSARNAGAPLKVLVAPAAADTSAWSSQSTPLAA